MAMYNMKMDTGTCCCESIGISKDDEIEEWDMQKWFKDSCMTGHTKYFKDVPRKEDVIERIKIYHDYNIERNEFVYRLVYEDTLVGRHQHNVILPRGHLSLNHDPNAVVDSALSRAKSNLADEVIEKYRSKLFEEEVNMKYEEYKDFVRQIEMVHGRVEIETESIGYMGVRPSSIAKITVPTDYLKYLKIQMPTTDFTKKKLNTDWIEGLPAIKKVETYNDRVTKVTFIDDTFTKAVCSENDHFDEDVGITICCMKRLFGKDGNRMYNDLIRQAHKIMTENDIAKEKAAKEKAEAKMKQHKIELKKAAKKLKAKEEQIDIHKQAIIRAHQEMEGLANEEA